MESQETHKLYICKSKFIQFYRKTPPIFSNFLASTPLPPLTRPLVRSVVTGLFKAQISSPKKPRKPQIAKTKI